MSPPREIELKLDVPARYLPRLTASPLLKSATTSVHEPANLVSVYFDTDKLELHRRGLSLRVRRIGRRLVQTVKQENHGNAALFDRGEWEHDVPTKQPNLDAMRDTALAPLLNEKLRRGLKPVSSFTALPATTAPRYGGAAALRDRHLREELISFESDHRIVLRGTARPRCYYNESRPN
jgi:hypothetical protein